MPTSLQIVGKARPNGAHLEPPPPVRAAAVGVSVSDAQMSQLRGLFENYSSVQAIFEHAARRERNQTVTRIDRLLAILWADGYDIDRPHLWEAFSLLEEASAGELQSGRGAERARFIWHVDMHRLGRKLTGRGLAPAAAKARRGLGQILLSHSFYLREDLPVMFKLPRDLKLEDVDRLTAYLRTLPMPND